MIKNLIPVAHKVEKELFELIFWAQIIVNFEPCDHFHLEKEPQSLQMQQKNKFQIIVLFEIPLIQRKVSLKKSFKWH